LWWFVRSLGRWFGWAPSTSALCSARKENLLDSVSYTLNEAPMLPEIVRAEMIEVLKAWARGERLPKHIEPNLDEELEGD
jgi:hypothetical protein